MKNDIPNSFLCNFFFFLHIENDFNSKNCLSCLFAFFNHASTPHKKKRYLVFNLTYVDVDIWERNYHTSLYSSQLIYVN